MAAYQTVLVGTDGSNSSFRAVERAATIAGEAGATLVILCAYYPASQQEVESAEDVLGDEAYQVVGSAPADDTLQSAADRARAAGAADIDTRPVLGDPAKTLLKAITKHSADLVVVGNRGLNTIAGRILGSVPASVSRQARCDVLIVHTVG
jgi:nucleotide-binding universal stress UspA family protein